MDVPTRRHFAVKKMICQNDEKLKVAKNEISTMVKITIRKNWPPVIILSDCMTRISKTEVMINWRSWSWSIVKGAPSLILWPNMRKINWMKNKSYSSWKKLRLLWSLCIAKAWFTEILKSKMCYWKIKNSNYAISAQPVLIYWIFQRFPKKNFINTKNNLKKIRL